MALILNIETSTKTCSVNLSKNGKSVGINEITSEKYVHGEKLHLLIKDLFTSSNLSLKQLDAVGVSAGPGSFTGLRIGVATAKGLTFGLDIPLISMNSLEIMINCYESISNNKKALFFPMIEAKMQTPPIIRGYSIPLIISEPVKLIVANSMVATIVTA